MKLIVNLSLFLFSLFIFENKSLSLTNNQITNICRKEKRKSRCIKHYQEKKSNLQKGNLIEIPVIPYKR